MKEVELSVLEINKKAVISKLRKLNAQKLQSVLLKVWWYCDIGDNPENLPWFLRIRSYSDKKYEVTWKSKSKTNTHSRSHKEINFTVDNIEAVKDFFKEINMKLYAYQEKKE